MSYESLYDELMTRAIVRELFCPLTGYTEKHHILPKSIFPEFKDFKKHPENCAILTAKEHYDAHILLVQMDRYKTDPNYNKLIFAANMMCVDSNGGRIDNERYEWLKILAAETHASTKRGKSYEELYGEERAKELKSKRSENMTDNNPMHSSESKEKAQMARNLTVKDENYISPNKGKSWEDKLGKEKSDKLKDNLKSSKTGISRLPTVCAQISATLKGKRKGIKQDPEHVSKRFKNRKIKQDTTIHHRIHPIYGEILCSRHELSKEFPDQNINKHELINVVKGSYNHRGWSIKKK